MILLLLLLGFMQDFVFVCLLVALVWLLLLDRCYFDFDCFDCFCLFGCCWVSCLLVYDGWLDLLLWFVEVWVVVCFVCVWVLMILYCLIVMIVC